MSEKVSYRVKAQRFGGKLSAMVLPNLGAFMGWGILTALGIWLSNDMLKGFITPMLTYLLPILIGVAAGKITRRKRTVLGICHDGCGCGKQCYHAPRRHDHSAAGRLAAEEDGGGDQSSYPRWDLNCWWGIYDRYSGSGRGHRRMCGSGSGDHFPFFCICSRSGSFGK